MISILNDIARYKHLEVAAAKKKKPQSAFYEQPFPPLRDFTAGLKKNNPAIIAEIKKASPSKGIIRADFDVAAIATIYEKHGASCLSVLTDHHYFQGEHRNLGIARANSTLPALRKDFIVDSYQIHESRFLGADCILLIVALLDDSQLLDYCQIARELGMAVLVESHTREELQRAVLLPTPLMGVNNRSLHTFKTDINTSLELYDLIPDDKFMITESGINTREDIKSMQARGINAFLIGESLMRCEDIGAKLDELIL
ncbi:indole-3-glycerol phosphate synthase TrpC [Legionella spiritensis]|uniref:indole-3-glycerol phosphate synthase TrpC n=1 Tax=Legionella spiritensis TaxID=452 RepID=UPI000F6F0E6B|nr:indole-3-glycerol phosphate synthase TrpC [Legionella spiritensis]VEG89704.1 indole-3-glycerol phosphate synthase [Legionella spiritensis]